ncbi:MAG: phosphoribosylanthranilate isomerase [Paracoccaceae bacterium]
MVDVRVKICGLRTVADVNAVAAAGAAYMGLNFFPRSPRYVALDLARELALAAPVGLAKVALVVDADDAALDAIVDAMPLDMLQLHGHESPERVAQVRARYGLPVMKVIGVADEGDLAPLLEFSLAADQIMIDAKPPKGAVLPGGNGVAFDWRLVAQRRWLRPWMLAGGLTPENVADAIRLTNARQVDVASGVEASPGVKDAARVSAFVAATRAPAVPRLR